MHTLKRNLKRFRDATWQAYTTKHALVLSEVEGGRHHLVLEPHYIRIQGAFEALPEKVRLHDLAKEYSDYMFQIQATTPHALSPCTAKITKVLDSMIAEVDDILVSRKRDAVAKDAAKRRQFIIVAATILSAFLCGITIMVWQIRALTQANAEKVAGFLDSIPTLQRVITAKTPAERRALLLNQPLVRVSGNVDVSGSSVDIDH